MTLLAEILDITERSTDEVMGFRTPGGCADNRIWFQAFDQLARLRRLAVSASAHHLVVLVDTAVLHANAKAPETFAAISLSNLGNIVLPPQIGGIYWHRHRGDPPEAVAAYDQAAEKLDRRGIALRDVWAPGTFKDFTAYAEAEYRAECAAAQQAMKGDVA